MTLREADKGDDDDDKKFSKGSEGVVVKTASAKTVETFHDNYVQASKNLKRNLYITHPSCRQVLALSQNILGSIHLLDVTSFRCWEVEVVVGPCISNSTRNMRDWLL